MKSGLIGGNTIQEILEHPQDYIESQKYFNWERFFTDILVQLDFPTACSHGIPVSLQM
mgnify:CR=1 FL=1